MTAARVAGIDLDRERLDRASLDVRLVADVADDEGLAGAIDVAAGRLGGLDAAVACAGVAGRGTVADTDLSDWEHIFAVNVRGVYLTARAAIPTCDGPAAARSSTSPRSSAWSRLRASAAYCASKGAVVQLTRAMAVDHGHEGIRVNCVCPGPTDTPLLEPYFAGSPGPGGRAQAVRGGPGSRPARHPRGDRGRDRVPALPRRRLDDRRSARRRRRLLDPVAIEA